MYYPYGEKELDYLKKKDRVLGQAIDRIGYIEREVDEDLFSSVIHHIVGQQISSAALKTVWGRMQHSLGRICEETIAAQSIETLQQFGMTFKKAGYFREFAQKVLTGEFDVASVSQKSDEEIVTALSSLNGIGVWTAEMIMTFDLLRPDILSYGDLAIHRGLRMLYHHKKIDKALFEKYRKRYSPYGTVASFYLWAIAAGAIEGMRDYAPKKTSASPSN